MLISCPKCSAVYQVPDGQIPADGKKFKCAECGEVWFVRPIVETKEEKPAPVAVPVKNQDVSRETAQVKSQVVRPEITQEDDLAQMFNRLSQDTKGLFGDKEQKSSLWSRLKRKLTLLFSPLMINCIILLVIFAFTIFIGYANRYELVSVLPQLENFYNKMGVESIYKGRGLVFQNVTARNVERHGRLFVEVSGKVANQSSMTSAVLPIKATLLRSDGTIESETVKILTLDKLESGFNALFHILLPDNTLEEKKVILVFDAESLPQSAEKAKKFSDKE